VTAKIFKQTNVCRVEPEPFDPKTFQLETETITHADGTTETRPADVHNVIRWRHVLDEDGKQIVGEDGQPKIESNAKVMHDSRPDPTPGPGPRARRARRSFVGSSRRLPSPPSPRPPVFQNVSLRSRVASRRFRRAACDTSPTRR
jgi:hypothetical protein